jgi:hypothetical protein
MENAVWIGFEGGQRSIVSRLAELAYDVLYMQSELEDGRYPASLWRPELQAYEEFNLGRIRSFHLDHDDSPSAERGTPEKRRLAATFNNYRIQNPQARLKRITAGTGEGRCGAGEVEIQIITRPQAWRVQYINSIKYDLCNSQGLDPRSDSCNHWADYGSRGALMAGRYKVRAIWADGETTYRNLNVDDLKGNTFTIRK